MTTRVEIVVKSCEGCAFYRRGALSAIADAMAKDGRRTGVCEYHAKMQPGAGPFLGMLGAFHVPDPAQSPPPNCPLRHGEVLIKLGAGR